jgi:hypothetical protein
LNVLIPVAAAALTVALSFIAFLCTEPLVPVVARARPLPREPWRRKWNRRG